MKVDARKVEWVRKLLKSKDYILITDRESVLSIKHVNPDNAKDMHQVAMVRATMARFRDVLDQAIKAYDAKLKTMKPTKSGKKIPVTKG